jgi:hypothetical protein
MDSLWEGRARRDEALERVQRHSSPWRALAYQALERVADRLPYLTSDDVWDELLVMEVPRPEEARAIGPVMVKGVRAGLIVPDGYVTGRDPRHHADVARRYRSRRTG